MRRLSFAAACMAASLVASGAAAGSRFNEDHYNRLWCDQAAGQAEVVLRTGARADCLTDEFAVEADWSN